MAVPATVNEILEAAFARFATKADLLNYKDGGAWRSVSTEEFRSRIRYLSLGLYQLGIRSGDTVGLLSENRIEWNIADLAVLTLGAVLVPVYATQAIPQVEFILRDAEVKLLFVSTRSQWQRVRHVCDSPRLRHVLTFERFDAEDPRQRDYSELLQMGLEIDERDPNLFEQVRYWPGPEELATLMYTSGTTGTPKGVMLTHGNLASNIESASQALGAEDGEINLSFLPFSHIYERLSFYMYLRQGNTIYYAESLDRLGENIREVRPTVMVAVPRVFEKMYEKIEQVGMSRPAWRRALFRWSVEIGKSYSLRRGRRQRVSPLLWFQYRLAFALVLSKWRRELGLARLRAFFSGGAPLSIDIACIFQAAGIEILQGYGLTETSPGISTNSAKNNKLGTVGRPLPGVEVRIDEESEILVRGPNVMRGYHRRAQENEAAFTKDGFLRTGDIGYLDEDGFLVVTDRKKDLLKTSGGKYIAPQPIENRLKQSPFITEAVLVADRRKFASALLVPNLQALRRWAKPRALEAPDEDALLRHPAVYELFRAEIERCNEGLGSFEMIKKFALLNACFSVDGGELTPTMKVRRRVVEEKYRALIDPLYSEDPPESPARVSAASTKGGAS